MPESDSPGSMSPGSGSGSESESESESVSKVSEPGSSQSQSSRPSGTLLGFDYGKRRIGVAVGQTMIGTANALAVVHVADHPDWQAIARLVDQWKPVAMVVGLPLAENGADTPMSLQARDFGRYLEKTFKTEVLFEDERLTSVDADERFNSARSKGRMRKKDAALKDAMAAQIILENWLQSVS